MGKNVIMGYQPSINGYDVTLYGLKGDGSTNNASALNTLLNTTAPTGSTIYFPPGTYNFGALTTVSNKYFNFVGHTATIAMTANTQFLDMSSTVALTGSGSRWTFNGFVFNGTGSGGSQAALYFSSKSGLFEVSDCLFTNWGNTGITVSTTNTASTSQAGSLGGIISNCRFYNNGKGVSCIDLGEYVQIIGCQFLANTTGIYLLGGNCIVTGNTISYNGTGIEIGTGTNPGKHIVSSNHVTHNSTYSINAHDTLSTQGLVMENNNIIVGTLRVANTYGVTISGGIINADAYTFDTNVGFIIKDVRSANSLANTITLTGTAPTYINCLKLDGSYAYNLDQFGASLEAFLATTNNTVTTLHTIAAIASSTTTVVGYVSARRTGGAAGAAEDGALYRVEFAIKNVSGTATIIGQVITVIGEDQAGWDVTLTGSSGNILIQVTGATNNNISWKWSTVLYSIV